MQIICSQKNFKQFSHEWVFKGLYGLKENGAKQDLNFSWKMINQLTNDFLKFRLVFVLQPCLSDRWGYRLCHKYHKLLYSQPVFSPWILSQERFQVHFWDSNFNLNIFFFINCYRNLKMKIWILSFFHIPHKSLQDALRNKTYHNLDCIP